MSATRSNAAEGETPPRSSGVGATYKFLSSVRLAILVLSFTAVACVIGTLLPQQAPAQECLSRYSESTYAIFRFLGLTDVFHSSWFLFLTGLFVVNLFLCSIERFSRLLKNPREDRIPNEKALRAWPNSFILKERRVEEMVSLFKGYRQAAHDDRGKIIDRGSISRYGVYVIHGSIIIILIGSLLGVMFGYRGFVTLGKGETKDTIIARDAKGTPIPLGFGIRLEDFQVSFYPDGAPKDYMSRIDIVDRGKDVEKADVRVNHPLSYKGASIYQATYGSDPVFLFNVGGKEVRLSQGGTYRDGALVMMATKFEPSIHNWGPGVQIAYLEGNETRTVWFVKAVPALREKEVGGVTVRLDDIAKEFYTGLEVSHDPGIWVVWTGFALILFGLYINFFVYYRRIYLLQTSEGVLVAGTSPRNKEVFREEFEKWREKANGIK